MFISTDYNNTNIINITNVDNNIYVLCKKVFNAFREIKAFRNGTSSA